MMALLKRKDYNLALLNEYCYLLNDNRREIVSEILQIVVYRASAVHRDTISSTREIHTRCVYHSLRIVRTSRGSIEPAIWCRYARACGFIGRVQRLAPGYTCLPPAIIVSLQGPIIEKPRLLSTPIARCETIFLLGAHEPRRWYVELPAIIVTYHRRAASFTGLRWWERTNNTRSVVDTSRLYRAPLE